MGTLVKYANSSEVEEALDKGVAAYVKSEQNKTDISSVKEDISEVTNAVFKRSTNLANTDNFTRGVVISSNGTVTENASYRTSEYIKIKSGGKYVGSALVFLAVYSEDKTFIKRINVTNGVSFTLPTNAKYVRITSNSIPEKWQLNEGDTLLEYEPFEDVNRIENNELCLQELDDRLSKTERSLEVRTDTVDVTYVVGRFNAIGTINWNLKTAVRTKEPVYVEKGGTVSCGDGYQIFVLFYSDDVFSYETCIGSVAWTTETVTIPENTYVGLMIADMAQTEQTDTSIADNICWDIILGAVPEVMSDMREDIERLERGFSSTYYHGKLDIKQSSVNHWYTCLTSTEEMADDGFGVSGSFEEGVSNDITTYAHIIEKFDALMALAPDYITKKSIGTAEGNDSNGNEYQIYEYTFKPRRKVIDLNTDVVPKILMDGGLHGFEKCAVYGLYYFMKDIVVNYSGNELLETLRNHVEFHIVPVSNPWGFDRDVRNNANGVNLNRNFPVPNWTFYDDTSNSSGAEPLSEKEAQVLSSWVLTHKDTMFLYINNHTNGHYNVSSYTEMNANMTSTDTNDEYFNKIFKVITRHIEDQTAHWSDMYENINPTYEEFCGKNQSMPGETHTYGELRYYISNYLKSNVVMVLEGFNGLRHNDEQIIGYRNRQAFKMNAENIGNMVAQLLCEYAD